MIHAESGGNGSPALLLLHGLGANAAVWRNLLPFVEQHWAGRWVAPDLRGHGCSPASPLYSYGAHAAAVAEALGPGERVAIIGHSMGGVVGLMLATGWFGLDVSHVLALGVKLAWSTDDIGRMENVAQSPVRWFENRNAAIDRYLRVSGLDGLVAPDSEVADLGIAEEAGRFRLAADPGVNGVGVPPFDDLLGVIKARVHFAAGLGDHMVSLDQMRRYDPLAEIVADAGHNAHVERPDTVWALFESFMQMDASATA